MTASAPQRNALETVRADDYIEYFLFPALSPNTADDDDQAIGALLAEIGAQVDGIVAQQTADYIWHKDAFRVRPRLASARLLRLAADGNANDEDPADRLPAHLYGITHFDDNVRDEWRIVALLLELTRRVPGLCARCSDADGEFVLIEAAERLPDWATPLACQSAILLAGGELFAVRDMRTMAERLAAVRRSPAEHRMSDGVQRAIAERCAEATGEPLHFRRAFVPLAAAALLRDRPALVAAAVRAFCQRDPVDLRACRAMRHFPPECRVRTGVRFTRYLYAMLSFSAFTPDRKTGWNLPAGDADEYGEHLLGVKLACGLEILAAQKSPADDNDWSANRAWLAYEETLQRTGYFRGLLVGSQGHSALLAAAREYFRTHVADDRTCATDAGDEVREWLRGGLAENALEEFRAAERDLPANDADDWLRVSPEELDAMLASRYGIRRTVAGQMNGNAADADANALTGNLREFLERKSEWDGICVRAEDGGELQAEASGKTVKFDVPSLNESCTSDVLNGSSVDFNPDDFQRHVREMLDLVIPEDDWESQESDLSDYENDEGLETIDEMIGGGAAKRQMQTYMDEMDAELARTTIGKSFVAAKKAPNAPVSDDGSDFDDIETFKPVDIDVNTLTNMANSYRSQFGGPGPASSLLGSMGIRVRPETAAEEPELYNTQV